MHENSTEMGVEILNWLSGLEKKAAVKFILDLLADIVGSFLYAIGIYTFAKMANFALGGLSGLALMINYLWGLPIGIMTFVLNIPFIFISYRVVGKRFLLKTARTMLISTFVLDVIFPFTPSYTGSPFMAALYSGLFMGSGMALFFMRGSSSGGIDLLTMTINVLKPHLSIGMMTMVVDLFIILLGWPAFGSIDAVLYGILATFITSLVLDKIMYGMGAGTLLIVITVEGKKVAKKISEITGRGSTMLHGTGTYTLENKDVLLCACSASQSYIVNNAIHEVDSGAFIMFTETSQVFGEGFKQIKKASSK